MKNVGFVLTAYVYVVGVAIVALDVWHEREDDPPTGTGVRVFVSGLIGALWPLLWIALAMKRVYEALGGER